MIAVVLGLYPIAAISDTAEPLQVLSQWRTWTVREGLPSNDVWAICVDGDRLWAGTADGLALLEADPSTCDSEDTSWRVQHWTAARGLPQAAVTAIDVDDATGDVWLGTWGGGLARYSAGRFDVFNQFNSGLSGDEVTAVLVADNLVWVATNGGVSVFDPLADAWALLAERRADVSEHAVMNLIRDGQRIWSPGWCGGVRSFVLSDVASQHAQRYELQDHDFNTVTIGNTRDEHLVGTLGLAVGRRESWRAALDGLYLRDADGPWSRVGRGPWGLRQPVHGMTVFQRGRLAVGTDQGLFVLLDRAREVWAHFRTGFVESTTGAGTRSDWVTVSRGRDVVDRRSLRTGLPSNRIRCVAAQDDRLWIGSDHGLTEASTLVPIERLPPMRNQGRLVGSNTLSKNVRVAAHAEVIPIAVIIPVARSISLPGETSKLDEPSPDVIAVQLAIDRANAHGGYRGQSVFTIEPAPDSYVVGNYGWGAFEDELALFAHRADIPGMIACRGPGRCASMLAALFGETPIVNVHPSAATLDERANPWVFRRPADDRAHHRRVLDYLTVRMKLRRLAIARTPGEAERKHLDDWSHDAELHGCEIVLDTPYRPESPAVTVERLRASNVEAVLTWCDAEASAKLLLAMRKRGMSQVFVGGSQIVDGDFVRRVGNDPGEVIAANPCWQIEDIGLERFRSDYAARSGRNALTADAFSRAVRSFVATFMLLDAINEAGPDRYAVRDVLSQRTSAVCTLLRGGEWQVVTTNGYGERFHHPLELSATYENVGRPR